MLPAFMTAARIASIVASLVVPAATAISSTAVKPSAPKAMIRCASDIVPPSRTIVFNMVVLLLSETSGRLAAWMFRNEGPAAGARGGVKGAKRQGEG